MVLRCTKHYPPFGVLMCFSHAKWRQIGVTAVQWCSKLLQWRVPLQSTNVSQIEIGRFCGTCVFLTQQKPVTGTQNYLGKLEFSNSSVCRDILSQIIQIIPWYSQIIPWYPMRLFWFSQIIPMIFPSYPIISMAPKVPNQQVPKMKLAGK